MGIESYGLVGFYLMLQMMFQVLDLGLSPTINREMARYSVQPERMDEARDLVRTLEVGYWFTGVFIGIALLAASGWVSLHWIHANSLSPHTVTTALMLMGILSFFQWPVSFYQGGLMGLHHQVLYNAIRILAATFNIVGGVLILWLVSPTITALLTWQVGVSAVQVVVLTCMLWKCLPGSRPARFQSSVLRNIWRFAAGMSGITAFSLILGQADKVILSKLFSLKVFGYYTVAGMFGLALAMITNSIASTVSPRFAALVAISDEKALSSLYHGATQLMAVLIVPIAAVLAIFSTQILQMWTGNLEIARNAGPIASVLVLGSMLNGLMYMPYTLQLAYGWTSIGLKLTIALTAIALPAIWFMAVRFGPLGAASVWLVLNAVSLIFDVPLTHRRVLRGEMPGWVVQDVLPPLVSTVLIAGIARFLLPDGGLSRLTTLGILTFVLLCCFLVSALLATRVRSRLFATLSNIWPKYA